MPKINSHSYIEKAHKSYARRGGYLGDFVYGANDGIITTFAVISGAAGAAFAPKIVIVLGLANLIADGFSMASSDYLAVRSRLDLEKKLKIGEEMETREFPEEEKREVRGLIKEWGLSGENMEKAVQAITSDKKRWVNFMMREELGIVDEKISPVRHGIVTFISFVIAGALPLIPYLASIFTSLEPKYWISIVVTACSLFVVGAARSLVTGKNFVYSGLEILIVGGIASSIAYGVGWSIKELFGILI